MTTTLSRQPGPLSPAAPDAAPAPGQSRLEPWQVPGAKPYVQLDRVTKKFGPFTAVDDVSLSIFKGELFSLLGGSGSGKTTLLRMLAGFERPTAGAILIDGVDMSATPPYERPVNMMFQSYALFPHMDVTDNIAFGLRQDGVARREIATRVADMLELVQLQPFARRRPHQLSGGQKQRVALARSLIKRPKLLLLDEPLAALDKKLREKTQFELVNIQEKVGVTFIVVTHDQEEAMTMCGRMAVMNAGRIVQVGTPSEIYEFPVSRFVADFIGTANMFEGRVTEDAPDHVRIRSPELERELLISHALPVVAGTPVSVAVRPEKMTLAKAAPAQDHNVASGIVRDIAYMGSLSIYIVELAGGKRVQVTVPNLTRMTERPITWGDAVHVSWGPNSGVVLLQ